MIFELSSAIWPRPITIDTDAPASDGPSPLAVIKPQIVVRPYPDGPAAVTWAPYGAPDSHALAFLWIAGLSIAAAFVVVGIARAGK